MASIALPAIGPVQSIRVDRALLLGPVLEKWLAGHLGPVRTGPAAAGPKAGSVKDRTGPDRVHPDSTARCEPKRVFTPGSMTMRSRAVACWRIYHASSNWPRRSANPDMYTLLRWLSLRPEVFVESPPPWYRRLELNNTSRLKTVTQHFKRGS